MNTDKEQAPGLTTELRVRAHRDRWTSYGQQTGIISVSDKPVPEKMLEFDLFKEFTVKFLEKISPDISIARWESNSTLFEEGSYIDLAFFIVSGEVEVYLKKVAAAPSPRSLAPESGTTEIATSEGSRDDGSVFETRLLMQEPTRGKTVFLSTMDFDLPAGGSAKLGAGDMFGEIGALSGWPQSATVRTTSECEVIQIRLPALRLLRRKSKTLKKRMDDLYREHTLGTHLRVTPLFRDCNEAEIQNIADHVELISCDPDDVIVREGEAPDGLYIVRSGFVKLSQRVGAGELVVSYISKGGTFGESELLNGLPGWLQTATSNQFCELVKVPCEYFEKMVSRHDSIEKTLWNSVVSMSKDVEKSKRDMRRGEFIGRALDSGLVEGTSILAIDLDVCTRCDDCVKGCAATHGGIPRFLREGDKLDNLLVTRACYHCRDPLCLAGCPTGAIRRVGVGDVIAIEDNLCIGCVSCANNCPYDAITMIDTGETWPETTLQKDLRRQPRWLATKCDLCHTDPAGPACVRSCPHGCAVRVGTLSEFENNMKRM